VSQRVAGPALLALNGKILEIDALVDPERLEQLDVSIPPIADKHL
jgi:hypothetical protein